MIFNLSYKNRENVISSRSLKCIYGNALSFNLVRSSLFIQMLKTIGEHEKGLKPLSYHELRVSYLKKLWMMNKNVLKNIGVIGINEDAHWCVMVRRIGKKYHSLIFLLIIQVVFFWNLLILVSDKRWQKNVSCWITY